MIDRPIRFTHDDLLLFSAASHDRNPLHLSNDYTRKTAYGRPVVFGVLAALACLGQLTARPAHTLARIVLEFGSPLFPGIDYVLAISEDSAEQASARLYDGQRVVLKLSATFQPGLSPAHTATTTPPARTEAADWPIGTLVTGVSVDGMYAPDGEQLAALIERWQLTGKGVEPAQLAALLWSSYLVGMELPGRRALFARLMLSWEQPLPTIFAYTARVRAFDQRFNLLRLDVRLEAEGGAAHGELRSFVLPETPGIGAYDLPVESSSALAGRVALVIGASRGLGARLVQALAWRGCTVVANFQHSQAEAHTLAASLADAPGKLLLLSGDGADLDWCAMANERILRDYGRLDILICNASPALVPLWLDPNALPRIHEFVAQSVALVSVPLAMFSAALAAQQGRAIVISSAAVTAPPVEWPHYVAAKCAIEGLTQVAAREYPAAHFAIVRPPRLQTDLTSTPAGYHSALPPEVVAAAICTWIVDPPATDQVTLLDTFAGDAEQ